MLILAVGFGAVFVGISTAANAGVPEDKAGLAAALLNTAQQVGGALGIAILSAISTARSGDLLRAGAGVPPSLTGGFGRALLAGSIALLAAAFVALRIANARGESQPTASATPASARTMS